MAVKQDINVGLVAFVGVVGAMLLLIVVWGVQAWYEFEVDAISEARYDAGQNVEWIDHKTEQYANIGDPVGNAAIYAAGMRPADREKLAAGYGYRFVSPAHDVAAVPIHAAMAEIVRRNGGGDANAGDLRAADLNNVAIVNEAYADVMTPNQAEPQDAPAPEPQAESAAGERGTATRPAH